MRGWTAQVAAVILSLCGGVAVADDGASAKPGRVMFWYDTEDYVSDVAPDAALFHAKLLDEFGFRGNFAVVGYYAQRLVERRRFDVVEALRRHCIGSQTLYHSRHPTICDYTDVADWRAAYGRCLAEESECMGILKAAFGLDAVNFFVPPGSSVTPVPMYVYSDRGVRVYGAGIDIFGSGACQRLTWYANMLQIPYNYGAGPDCAEVPGNDVLASRAFSVIYTHPCQLDCAEFWDTVNYQGRDLCAWRQWKKPRLYSDERRAANRRAWRELMTRIKDDPRLTVVDCDEVIREIKPRVVLRRSDVPRLLAAMERGLEPIEEPSWSVSDVFQAAVAFLRGAETFEPKKAWGFLEKPTGVTEPVILSRDDLVAAAKAIDPQDFVPSQIAVGAQKIGPADFLIAALKALASDAESVTVSPRDQVGPIGKHLPNLPDLRLTQKGWCIYSDEMKDAYVTDRLRGQFWTLRYE